MKVAILLRFELIFHLEKLAYDGKHNHCPMNSAEILPTLPAFQLLGQPVEVSRVEKELQALFLAESGDDAENAGGIARASLINLALYNENQDELENDASSLAELTSESACRSLLINADTRAASLSAQAWIQAHCQIDRSGQKSVCTEQISFFLSGDSPGLLRNIVFANLDSDLPLAFWWKGEFSDAFEERLYSRIDRLLFDSETWASPRNQFLRLCEAQDSSSSPFVMHDLAFTRLNSIRHAVANAFDANGISRLTNQLDKIQIRYAKGYRMSSLYLASWISGRLGGRPDLGQSTADTMLFTARSKKRPDAFEISLEELSPDRKGTLEVDFHMGETRIEISRCQTRDFLRTLIHRPDCPTEENWLPARRMSDVTLVADVLNRAGKNRTHSKTLAGVKEMLTL